MSVTKTEMSFQKRFLKKQKDLTERKNIHYNVITKKVYDFLLNEI